MSNGAEVWQIYKSIKTEKIGLDLDYGITVIDNRVYLCFDGSNSKTDWFYNFMFPTKVYKDQVSTLKMHRGYIKIWKSANDQIMTELINKCSEVNDIHPFIIGHSLGGALSLFAAEDFNYRTGRSAEVITFGAPKACGNKQTAKYIKAICESVSEYEQKNDIVPFCPPLPWFRHVQPVKIGAGFNLFKFLFKVTENHHDYANPDYYKGL